jgi:uncharacterized C2H2 Zn-finger protein
MNKAERDGFRAKVTILGKRAIFPEGIGAGIYRCPGCGWLTTRLEAYICHIEKRTGNGDEYRRAA